MRFHDRWTAYISVMPNLRLGVAVTMSANGKQDVHDTFMAHDANELALETLAPALDGLLKGAFPAVAPVPAGVDVAHVVGDYNVTLVYPLFQASIAFNATSRVVSTASPLGSYQVGFVRQLRDLSVFRLPANHGCQDGTLNFEVQGDGSVKLTVPYTYAGMVGMKAA